MAFFIAAAITALVIYLGVRLAAASTQPGFGLVLLSAAIVLLGLVNFGLLGGVVACAVVAGLWMAVRRSFVAAGALGVIWALLLAGIAYGIPAAFDLPKGVSVVAALIAGGLVLRNTFRPAQV